MAVPIPPPKEFPKPGPISEEYKEGVEVTVPPSKIYTLQFAPSSANPTSLQRGWYICKEGRSGVAIVGVDFRGDNPINVEDTVDPTTSQAIVETQIRIEDVGNVGD